MAETFDDLREAWGVRDRSRESPLGRPATFRRETTSTNDDAKAALSAGAPHGSLFVADFQTAGRGRQGRSWQGEAGASLLFSVLLRCPIAGRVAGAIPVAAGICLAEAIDGLAGRTIARVKWPNDVLINGRKVAGVLSEATVRSGSVEGVIVGVGVNVGKMQDAIELSTSLADAGVTVARVDVLEAFLSRFGAVVERVAHHGLRDFAARVAAKHDLAGSAVRRSDGAEALAESIDEEGRLVVLREGVRERWSSGEVHLSRGVPS